MGVPKFFKYIGERYPCLTEKLKEHKVPEFDNLYLDMNGIIHTCSHPNDTDVKFRITEEAIFKNIFHYIEVLFRIIKPRKLFFLAVDGVAPRAKINQQRSRRFRAAKDSELLELRAKNQGVDLPKESRFDSNCITPGTLFMAKLNKQLRYFISYKITTDNDWRECKVILSGSEVPGEGEHKIMDYIRYMKSQPDYDSNTRHCLYGLDADLIMLGLCTHEPHFTLLREEVIFGKQQKKIPIPEETNFCLLHLTIMREYLEHEFSPMKEKLPFMFDIEKIIDDWVLMGFLVGNDFIPHLPNFHIAQGILNILYKAYMDVLPTLDGYINEAGTLNLPRFEKFMEKLSEIDFHNFEQTYEDLLISKPDAFKHLNDDTEGKDFEPFDFDDLSDSADEQLPKKRPNKALEALINNTMDYSEEDENSDEEFQNLFVQHKKSYYMNKLDYARVDKEVLRAQAEGYVRAIQWNLHYYYNGCCSWSWYYPHHYAPYISDIKGFKDLKLEFDIGKPFLPFQQLLAVLPAASSSLLPAAYQDLLLKEKSPIIQYYPTDFMTDLNGKVHDWEAVVLIPFIEEDLLLEAMEPYNSKLMAEEIQRNQEGPMCEFSYSKTEMGICSAPEYFPEFMNKAEINLIYRNEILVPKEKLRKGLCPDVNLDVYFRGFPTLRHIKHTGTLCTSNRVKVFGRVSREVSIILNVTPKPTPNIFALAKEVLGKSVFVNWPHMVEAKVIAISNSTVKLNWVPQSESNHIAQEDFKQMEQTQWMLINKSIVETHQTRMGIELGDVNIIVHACPIIGMKHTFLPQGRVSLEKNWQNQSNSYPLNTVVRDITAYEPSIEQYNNINEIFTPGTTCFMLGRSYYGSMGKVIEEAIDCKSWRVKVLMILESEPDLSTIQQLHLESIQHYMNGSTAAQHLGISSHLLSRITGTMYVVEDGYLQNEKGNKFNFGLNLKFNKKNSEIKGYTKKGNGLWLYSMKAVQLIKDYMQLCPELFNSINQSLDVSVFECSSLFPEGSEQMKKVCDWLKEQQKNLVPRSCDEVELAPELIPDLEKVIDDYVKVSVMKQVVMQVKPSMLYKPGLNPKTFQPDPNAEHRLLDRIIVVKETSSAPTGYKGTIIGIQKEENVTDFTYTVLFDKALGEETEISPATQRTCKLTAFDFINRSHGIRMSNKKVGANATPSVNFNKVAQPQSQNWRQESRDLNDAMRNVTLQSAPHAKQFSQNANQNKNQMMNNGKKINPPHQSKKFDQTTEFQALWNECHKDTFRHFKSRKPVPDLMPKNQSANMNVPTSSQHFPQDPSAFLKAMLKISDESNSAPSPQVPKSTQQAPKPSDAPPMVQLLFDNARKAERLKSQHQQAMNNQIFPPQMNPMENMSDRVCKMQRPMDNYPMMSLPIPAPPPPQQWVNNMRMVGPDIRRAIPRPNFPPPLNRPNYPMPRPKWASPPVQQPAMPQRSFFFPRKEPIDKTNWRVPQKVEQETKKNTPFVPLQAVKKSRNVESATKTPQGKQKAADEQASHKEQASKQQSQAAAPLPKKDTSNECQEKKKQLPDNAQKSQIANHRKRKSRLAANFGNCAVANGGQSQ